MPMHEHAVDAGPAPEGGVAASGVPRRPRGVVIDGVMLLDKPEGLSSNAALQRAKRLLGAAKAGHTGTLDPLATGLLPICLGDATKFSQGLLDADKVYVATARLGISTDTGDREGRIVAERPVDIEREAIEAVLRALTGAIDQVPPMYSALKHHGRPLYAIAREGGAVERAPRRVVIHRLSLVDWVTPSLSFCVHCSKGTYVRTLAEEIGDRLGTGAHLTALRRTAVGPFNVDAAVTLDSLEREVPSARLHHILAADAMLLELPALVLDPGDAERLLQGRELDPPKDGHPVFGGTGNTPDGALVRVYAPATASRVGPAAHRSMPPARPDRAAIPDSRSRFLGVGHVDSAGRLRAVRLIAHIPARNSGKNDGFEPKPVESA